MSTCQNDDGVSGVALLATRISDVPSELQSGWTTVGLLVAPGLEGAAVGLAVRLVGPVVGNMVVGAPDWNDRVGSAVEVAAATVTGTAASNSAAATATKRRVPILIPGHSPGRHRKHSQSSCPHPQG